MSEMMHFLIQALWNLRFPGKSRLFSYFINHQGIRNGRVFGAEIELDLSDYVQRSMYLGCFEREETNTLTRYLKPGMIFVDVGANAGYYTYLAASRVGIHGKVIAIEPDPILFTKLDASITKNALQNVAALNVGLGRTQGVVDLYIPPISHHNRSPTMTPVREWNKLRVPIKPLDDVLNECNQRTVDLLKLDVEGFEVEVLAGAGQALRDRRIKAILCEFNDYWLRSQGTSPKQLFKIIESFGFRAAVKQPELASGTNINLFFTLA